MFVEIYSIGILTVIIRHIVILFARHKEIGETLNDGRGKFSPIVGDAAAKWVSAFTFIIVLLGLAVLWPISIPNAIYNWYKDRKDKSE